MSDLVLRQFGDIDVTAFLNVDTVFLVDISYSMVNADAGESRTRPRYQVMAEVLDRVRREAPGRTLTLAFADTVQICVAGLPSAHGNTDMAGALRVLNREFAGVRLCDLFEKVILISDGEPNIGLPTPEEACYREASQCSCPIDTVYVGPPNRQAQDILSRISSLSGGRYHVSEIRLELAQTLLKALPG